MSISYRKINSMIEDEVKDTDLTDDQAKLLAELCKKIYMIESSLENTGSHQTISDIKGEITLKANDF